jgi:hypothetical protein
MAFHHTSVMKAALSQKRPWYSNRIPVAFTENVHGFRRNPAMKAALSQKTTMVLHHNPAMEAVLSQ